MTFRPGKIVAVMMAILLVLSGCAANQNHTAGGMDTEAEKTNDDLPEKKPGSVPTDFMKRIAERHFFGAGTGLAPFFAFGPNQVTYKFTISNI